MIQLKIEHPDHHTTVLTNDSGDTFTFNPLEHEGLADFLSGAKNISFQPPVSGSLPKSTITKEAIEYANRSSFKRWTDEGIKNDF